ncbi:MAG: hypothetical protein JXB26_13255 [Candidatus Aminicenantes bacterium]|nr:hypothetical protein [Candidatus Aminicenantes bacterium]
MKKDYIYIGENAVKIHTKCRWEWIFLLTAFLIILTSGTTEAAGPEDMKTSILSRFSLKIGGGIGFLSGRGGDLDSLRLGLKGLLEVWGAETTYTNTFDWNPMTKNCDFPVELMVSLKPGVSIGLGSGFINADNQGSYMWDYYNAAFLYGSGFIDDNNIKTTHDFRFRVIPACVNIYLSQPLGALTVYSFGGIGFYWGKMTHSSTIDYEIKSETFLSYYTPPFHRKREEYGNLTIEENLRKGSLGFQGGVGSEILLFRGLVLGLEIYGRHLVFSRWEGDTTTDYTKLIKTWDYLDGWYPDITETGTITKKGILWFSQIYDPLLGRDIDAFVVEEAGALTGPEREARIELSSIGIHLTLRIYFGRSF